MSDLVAMQLTRIILTEISQNQVIYLREVDGERQFPILIGQFEAASINRRVQSSDKPARPLTHDLVANTISALGGVLESIVITDLQEQTYFAELRIRVGDRLVAVDARPSDAIAVAVTFQPSIPILVDERVLAKLNLPPNIA